MLKIELTNNMNEAMNNDMVEAISYNNQYRDRNRDNGDRERMYRRHWERYMHFKRLEDEHRNRHDHYGQMARYHYLMWMHYLRGTQRPPMPREYR